jgi:hypothetical protein
MLKGGIMRRKTLKTALGVILLSILVVFGLTASAYAISGETQGAALLYTYYDVRNTANPDLTGNTGLNLTDNYFTVTNTSTQWSQVHVRVRTGHHSIELLDFDVLLSPKDVFTFDLYADNGATIFASCDTKTLINSGFTPNFDRNGDGTDDCFVLDSTTFPQMLSLILTCDPDASTAELALDHTRKGYVEVIGEALIDACPTDKTQCASSPCCGGCSGGTTPFLLQVSDPGKAKLLENLETSALSINDNCGTQTNGIAADVHPMYPVLIGAEYFATVTNGKIMRLARLNAENVSALTAHEEVILHAENYSQELASSNCSGADDPARGCYAYILPTNENPSVTNGADDLNMCLYKDTIIPTGGTTPVGVQNKFGAGATYGPTLADIAYLRDGTLATIINSLNEIAGSLTWGVGYIFGRPYYLVSKDIAETHYFATPAPGIYDVDTQFAFIFPLQHFIKESERISADAIYDNEENTTTITVSKFISPGLPTQVTPAVEANLFNLVNPPFAEGWIQFGLTATNPTSMCTTPGDTTTMSCEVADGTTSYTPGSSGAVFNTGANELSVSPWHYNGGELMLR